MMRVFPDTGIEKLGFDAILERIEGYLKTDQGRTTILSQTPSSDFGEVRRRLDLTEELQSAIEFDDPVPHGSVVNIKPFLDRIGPAGSFLDGADLLEIRALAVTVVRLRKYFESRIEKYRLTAGLFGGTSFDKRLASTLGESLEDDGSVSASASPELRKIRRERERLDRDLRKTLAREFSKAGEAGFAADGQPTVRAGRHVMPVRVEAKRKISGFIHDVSATGQTVFVEPAACLDLNNELRTIDAKERREIIRILTVLTDSVRSNAPALLSASTGIGIFDVHHAMALLAIKLKASVPALSEEPGIQVINGRNPLLALFFKESGEDREVVPLNLNLGDACRTLIISGPNAGGKTVTIKTVGAYVLMLSIGMPIPADPLSRFSIPTQLFIDIGDEQSLEEDLSSYSSHLTRMKHAIENVDARSLVLIDEIGAATDPDQGAAVALATLNELSNSNGLVIVTTHFGKLKAVAESTPDFGNASMEFDSDRLVPTYRFIQGLPGSSYALEIAARVGMSEKLVSQAREIMGAQESGVEELMAKLEQTQKEVADLHVKLDAELASAQKSKETYELKLAKQDVELNAIRLKAIGESQKILKDSRAQIERTIRVIRESGADKVETKKARAELTTFVEKVDRKHAALTPLETKTDPAVSEKLSIGDSVVIDDGSTPAEVVEIRRNDVTVVASAGRLMVKRNRLRKVGGPRKQQVNFRTISSSGDLASSTARNRIDLRGKRVDEALSEVLPFCDQAVAANLYEATILHGTGTGALRNAIREYLNTRRDVLKCEDAEWEAGGPGVTVITFAP